MPFFFIFLTGMLYTSKIFQGEEVGLFFPDPDGPLSSHISTKCIKRAYDDISLIHNDDHLNITDKCSLYLKVTSEQRLLLVDMLQSTG